MSIDCEYHRIIRCRINEMAEFSVTRKKSTTVYQIRDEAESVFSEVEGVVGRLNAFHGGRSENERESIFNRRGTGYLQDVDKKVESYKRVLAENGQNQFLELIISDMIVAKQLERRNEILAKANHELSMTLDLAMDFCFYKVDEGIIKLQNVVQDAIEVADSCEQKAIKVQEENEDLKQDISGLNSQIEELRRIVAETEEAKENAKAEITNMKGECGRASAKLTDLESQLTKTDKQLADMTEKHFNLHRDMNARSEELEKALARVKVLEETLNTDNERHRRELVKVHANWQEKMKEQRDQLIDSLRAEKETDANSLNLQLRKSEEERQKVIVKLESAKSLALELRRENERLRLEQERIKDSVLAQVRRNITSAMYLPSGADRAGPSRQGLDENNAPNFVSSSQDKRLLNEISDKVLNEAIARTERAELDRHGNFASISNCRPIRNQRKHTNTASSAPSSPIKGSRR